MFPLQYPVLTGQAHEQMRHFLNKQQHYAVCLVRKQGKLSPLNTHQPTEVCVVSIRLNAFQTSIH